MESTSGGLATGAGVRLPGAAGRSGKSPGFDSPGSRPAGAELAQDLKFSQAIPFDLPLLSLEGLLQVVATNGPEARALTDQGALIEHLYKGDPLRLTMYCEDLQAAGWAAPQIKKLKELSPGLKGYFKAWWKEQERQWQESAATPELAQNLIDLLACAKGPVTVDDIAAIGRDVGPDRPDRIRKALESLSRFFIARDEGVIFAHPRLGVHFQEEMGDEVQAWHQRIGCTPRQAPPAGLFAIGTGPKYRTGQSSWALSYGCRSKSR